MSLINIDKDLQTFIRATLQQYPAMSANGQIPPHHSLHYGKSTQNAVNNLNKVSGQKELTQFTVHNGHTTMQHNTIQHTRGKSMSNQPATPHYMKPSGHRRGISMSISSFSSYNPAGHHRKPSASYSLSEQSNIMQELNKRQVRQQSTPNSIGSFFKQKFQKQRSFNSQRSNDNVLYIYYTYTYTFSLSANMRTYNIQI